MGVSFLSGLLGIGGGIILAPLLLYVPPAFGSSPLDMRAVAGLTMIQGLAAASIGALRHHVYGFVSWRLVAVMGTSIGSASLVGAVASQAIAPTVLQAIFAMLALLSAVLLLAPRRGNDDAPASVDRVQFNAPLAAILAAFVGLLGGLVGQGGAFLLVPLMLTVLRLQTRIVLGSSLGIVLCSALAGAAGKLATGQVSLPLAVALVSGAMIGAPAGAFMSRRAQPKQLRVFLAAIVAATAIRMWSDLI